MSDERFSVLKRILIRALELPAGQRDAWVREACAGDEQLHAEVLAKLARLGDDASVLLTGGFEALVRAADPDVTMAHGPGTSAGGDDRTLAAGSAGGEDRTLAAGLDSLAGYRILGKLGEGGMGVVYLAEQQSPRRRVALKVIRGGRFVDDLRVKMFQREAETLGRLKHPNIAAIYESGRTGDGQHFFAMELVQGATLDEYLRSREPDRTDPGEVRFRLRLFLEIAAAVHYAHQRGVIHRDLKPSNIVVTEETSLGSGVSRASGPGVKVLDFGLARITDSDVKATTVSEVGAIKGTLPYMSPEQTRGNPDEIDVRTDVYSLGVILYEMLTSSLPYDTGGTSLAQALRVICEEPPRTMRTASTGRRGLDPDVETICRRALEKEADRRYSTAAALADDVARYLASEPIVARPPSTMYQLRKFAARNRTLVGGVAATFVALAAGIVVAATLGLREAAQRRAAVTARNVAERETDRATHVQGFLQDMITSADPYQSKGPLTTMGEVLKSASEKIGEEFGDRPDVQGSLRFSIGRTYVGFAQWEDARAQLEPALALMRETRPGDHLETAECLRFLGECYEGLRRDDCLPLMEESVEMHERLQGADHLDTATAKHDLAFAYQVVAMHSPPARRDSLLALSERTYLESQKVFLAEKGEDEAYARCLQAYSLTVWQRGRREEAVALIDKAIRIAEAAQSEIFLESLYQDSAFQKRALGDYEASIAAIRKSIRLKRKIWGEGSIQDGWGRSFLADLYRRMSRPEDAVEELQAIAAIQEEQLGRDHRDRVDTLEQEMRAYGEIGDPQRGADVGRECLALWRAAAESDSSDASAQVHFADALLHAWPPELRSPEEAVRFAERGCELADGDDPRMLEVLTRGLLQVGRAGEAAETAERALAAADGESEVAASLRELREAARAAGG